LTGIRGTATGYGGRNRQADGAIGCFIHRADLDYCRVRYEMILVLVQLFSSYKRYRYGTSAVAPLGLSSPLLRTALCCSRVEGRGMVFRAAVPVANLMKWGIRLRRRHCSQVRSAIRLKPCCEALAKGNQAKDPHNERMAGHQHRT
jgi:hypothetical protein